MELLEDYLSEIGYHGESMKKRYSASDFSRIVSTKPFFDPVLDKLFDLEQEIPENYEHKLVTTLREVVLNSASSLDYSNDQYIDLQLYFGSHGLVSLVSDPGPGFDHKKELEKTREVMSDMDEKEIVATSDEPILTTRDDKHPGRAGIYCLLNYTTRFKYNDKGNEVIMQFIPK